MALWERLWDFLLATLTMWRKKYMKNKSNSMLKYKIPSGLKTSEKFV